MVSRLLSRLPLPVLYVAADLIAIVLDQGLRYRREVVRDNLARAFPSLTARDITRLARGVYRNLADVLVEIVKAPSLSAEALGRRVRIRNPEVLEPYTGAGQAVLFLASHQCNWEWLLLAMGAHLGRPIDPIYKPLHDRRMDQAMLALRSRFGSRPIPVKSAVLEIMKRRNSSGGFAIVADQAPPKEDEVYWTAFLGRDTAFYVGPERIARIGRFPVIFVAMKRLARGRYEIALEVLATPPHATAGYPIVEGYARRVEAMVRAHPADWLWTHRRWKYPKPLYG
jgi:KDO2-lipid IV(A) lauroyltransferase